MGIARITIPEQTIVAALHFPPGSGIMSAQEDAQGNVIFEIFNYAIPTGAFKAEPVFEVSEAGEVALKDWGLQV